MARPHIHLVRARLCAAAWVAYLAPLVASGCTAGDADPRASGPTLAVNVAPLALAGVGNACYGVTVNNQLGAIVWSESGICADDFGDGGGAIAYVGTCDASLDGLPPGDTVDDNSVTLVLEDLYQSDAADGTSSADLVAESSYLNPCGPGPGGANWDGFGPCVQRVPCVANADASVAFDITVLRRAGQGFFDLAVTFEDVFCSAKLDCVDGFVIDPTSGKRVPSFVLGFACTSGSRPDTDGGGPEPTWLYLSDVVLACDGLAPMRLPLASVVADGNQGAVAPGIVQWMQMSAHEDIGGDAFDKCTWNLAGGLDLAALGARTCTLTATGAAASSLWPGDVPPVDAVRPVVSWSVPVLDHGVMCQPQPLDGAGSGVRTTYIGAAVSPSQGGAAALQPFVRHHRCGDASAPCDLVDAGMAGWWRLDGDGFDALGDNDGTVIGGTFVAGVAGQALQYSASNQGVRVPLSAGLDVGEEFTIEAWIMPAEGGSFGQSAHPGPGPIVELADAVSFFQHPTSRDLHLALRTADGNVTTDTASNVVTSGVWNHAAVTYSATEGVARFYANGALVRTWPVGALDLRAPASFNIGERPVGSFDQLGVTYHGSIDEVGLWRRALDADEIHALYLAGSAGHCPGVGR